MPAHAAAEKGETGLAITVYELLGADDRRFSPYCWRTRMALAHKGLEATYVPCRFTEKDRFAFANYDRMPLLTDGESTVGDSWAIACHLEETYPDRPSLFGGAIGRAEARFFNEWIATLSGPVMRMIVKDIFDRLDPVDQPYFRATREPRFGATLEEMGARSEEARPAFEAVAAPLRAVLAHQPFFCGDAPAYADYIVFGTFQIARSMSPLKLVEPGDPLYDWRCRLLDLHGALGRSTNAYPE
jgi:glutathione S-transferase